MADVASTVAAYLKAKGLPTAAIAAVLGNMQIESGFRTDAVNAGEGAVGLIQWEGGRRANLQNFAASQGKSETDLGTQLDFMWHELNTDYSGVLSSLRSATNPAQAAAVFDGQYEVSSGSSRAQRISAAQSFAGGNYHGGGDVASAAYSTAIPAAATAAPTLTPEQKKAALLAGIGPLSAIIATTPELNTLLLKAVTTGMTAEEFQNAVNNSTWYRTHSDSIRSSLVLAASDPATYAKQLKRAGDQVKQLMLNMGVTPTGTEYVALAKGLQSGMLDAAQVQTRLAQSFARTSGPMGQNYSAKMATGQAAVVDQQLREIYDQYGLQVQPGQMGFRIKQVLAGNATVEDYKAQALIAAKAMYPGMSHQLDSNLTVKDVADPYIQTMAQTLELNPKTISINDRLVKQALQGTGVAKAGQAPTATPMWQFEQQLRSDPRWDKTNNAKQATSAMLMDLGKSWGMTA